MVTGLQIEREFLELEFLARIVRFVGAQPMALNQWRSTNGAQPMALNQWRSTNGAQPMALNQWRSKGGSTFKLSYETASKSATVASKGERHPLMQPGGWVPTVPGVCVCVCVGSVCVCVCVWGGNRKVPIHSIMTHRFTDGNVVYERSYIAENDHQ
jgi:hypothetical protein